jgi:hypothetical protein
MDSQLTPRRTSPSSRWPSNSGSSPLFSVYLLSFHTLANSLASAKILTLFFSSNSELFYKNTRGWVSTCALPSRKRGLPAKAGIRFFFTSLPHYIPTSSPRTHFFATLTKIFHSPYPATPLFATLTQTAGVYVISSQKGTRRKGPLNFSIPALVRVVPEACPSRNFCPLVVSCG